MTPDIAELRRLKAATESGFGPQKSMDDFRAAFQIYTTAILSAAPALFDEVERLRAEKTRLCAKLMDMADNTECDINEKGYDLVYTTQQRKHDADMAIVIEARQLVADLTAQKEPGK